MCHTDFFLAHNIFKKVLNDGKYHYSGKTQKICELLTKLHSLFGKSSEDTTFTESCRIIQFCHFPNSVYTFSHHNFLNFAAVGGSVDGCLQHRINALSMWISHVIGSYRV